MARIIASSEADEKAADALGRIVRRLGGEVRRTVKKGALTYVGVVMPLAKAAQFKASVTGWEFRDDGTEEAAPARGPEPKAEAVPKSEKAEQSEKTAPRPHPLVTETLEARLGCAWGSPEMESIAQSIGMNTAQLAHLADSPGHAFGHFRFDPWKLWIHLGGRTLVSMRDPQPKTADVLKLLAKKYGEECEAVKFYRLQSVWFRPELLQDATKRRAK